MTNLFQVSHWLLEEGKEYEGFPHGVVAASLELQYSRIYETGLSALPRLASLAKERIEEIKASKVKYEACVYRFKAYGITYPCVDVRIIRRSLEEIVIGFPSNTFSLTSAAKKKFVELWGDTLKAQFIELERSEAGEAKRTEELQKFKKKLLQTAFALKQTAELCGLIPEGEAHPLGKTESHFHWVEIDPDGQDFEYRVSRENIPEVRLWKISDYNEEPEKIPENIQSAIYAAFK